MLDCRKNSQPSEESDEAAQSLLNISLRRPAKLIASSCHVGNVIHRNGRRHVSSALNHGFALNQPCHRVYDFAQARSVRWSTTQIVKTVFAFRLHERFASAGKIIDVQDIANRSPLSWQSDGPTTFDRLDVVRHKT